MIKKKIAISIDPRILHLVDSFIDNSTIRSRSQAIEYLLEKALGESPIECAVILIHPKNLNVLTHSIDNVPLIILHLKFLKQYGIHKIIIVTKKGPLIKKIDSLVKAHNYKIEWVFEQQPKGTAHAIASLKNRIRNHFVLLNGDSYNDFDLLRMFNVHMQRKKIMTLGLYATQQPKDYGTVIMEGDTITHYMQGKKGESFIANAGVYIMSPEIFPHLKGHKSLEREVLPKLADKNELVGFILPKRFIHLPEKD